MNSENSSNDIKNDIMTDDYVDVFDNLINSLKKHIRRYYISNNKKVEDLTSDLVLTIKSIIERTITQFGHIPDIVRFCLKKYFNNGNRFSSRDLYEKIENIFYYHKRQNICKILSNEYYLNKKNPKVVVVERGTYSVKYPYE